MNADSRALSRISSYEVGALWGATVQLACMVNKR